jgi:hypothetical protein
MIFGAFNWKTPDRDCLSRSSVHEFGMRSKVIRGRWAAKAEHGR